MTPYALITGGAGFVGSNLADRLLSDGHEVVILDSLVRANVKRNAAWLSARHGDQVRLVVGDVRDAALVRDVVAGADQVFHLAAQVAVTRSLVDPVEDFGVNAAGTLNVLEAIRARTARPPLIFSSTNKVYGALDDVSLRIRNARYEPAEVEIAAHGIGESRPLEFHSPYGCSKGAADQYVLDYARTYELPACVFRMSCIYGPRQFGTEDQGWLAHFLIRARRGEPIVFYGDGQQVRDALFVEDLIEAFLAARDGMARLRGHAFNVGGGPGRTTSLWELVDAIEVLHGRRPMIELGPWRLADQRWYVSDCRALCAATGWSPTVSLQQGLARLDRWVADADLHDGPQTATDTQGAHA